MPTKTTQDGPRAIDKIRAAYQSKRRLYHSDLFDLDLYFGQLTRADEEAIENRIEDEESRYSKKDKNILLLIHKAENEDGTKAFRMGDFNHLKDEAPVAELNRIIAFMYLAAMGKEDPKGESSATDGSATESS